MVRAATSCNGRIFSYHQRSSPPPTGVSEAFPARLLTTPNFSLQHRPHAYLPVLSVGGGVPSLYLFVFVIMLVKSGMSRAPHCRKFQFAAPRQKMGLSLLVADWSLVHGKSARVTFLLVPAKMPGHDCRSLSLTAAAAANTILVILCPAPFFRKPSRTSLFRIVSIALKIASVC